MRGDSTRCRLTTSARASSSSLVTRRRAGFGGALVGEVLAPGEDGHAERMAVARHAGADAAEADEAERLAREHEAGRRVELEAARAHRRFALRDAARGGEHQRQRQLRGALDPRSAIGVADDDAPLLQVREVDLAGAHAGEAEHPQRRQPVDQRLRKRRALARGEDHVEAGEGGGRVVLRRERLGEERTSARASSGAQSAQARATRCQSSSTATRVIGRLCDMRRGVRAWRAY